jgi:hypothetical protein
VKKLAPDVACVVELLTTLTVEGHKVPLPLRRLLPDPLRSLEQWQRFVHHDIDELSPAARNAEAFRLRVAIAQADEAFVPQWPLERVSRLEAAA